MEVSTSRDQKMLKQQDQIDELRKKQSEVGLNQLPTVTANRNANYKVRQDEADRYVHVRTRNKHYQSATKSFQFEDRIIPIHKNEFDRKVKEDYFSGYDEVEVIHDPREGASAKYAIKTKSDGAKSSEPVKQSDNSELNERVQALRKKEAELLAKQTEFEEREAKIGVMEEFRKSAIIHTELVDKTPKS
jgi:hypothetical protein